MVSLVQVSQYTVISAWNSMITPAVKKKGVIKLIFCMKLKSKYINYNIRFLKLLLYDLKWSNNNDKKCA
jgi:hypothetical protein